MLNLLLKPLLGVASQAVTGFVETKKAKAESKLVEIKAKTALREKQIAGEISWEASAVDQMKGSWKDEFWTLIFGGILISCFLPWTQSYVAEGFRFLDEHTPQWFSTCLIICISASFGIKGATGAMKMFGKKK